MEVADEVVVMNRGQIEQIAGPRSLYDRPANEFVMSFVGSAHRFGEQWVRPHDLEIVLEPEEGTREAQIDRVVHLGFRVRCELSADDGTSFTVELTRDQQARLELDEGAIVWVRPMRATAFAAG